MCNGLHSHGYKAGWQGAGHSIIFRWVAWTIWQAPGHYEVPGRTVLFCWDVETLSGLVNQSSYPTFAPRLCPFFPLCAWCLEILYKAMTAPKKYRNECHTCSSMLQHRNNESNLYKNPDGRIGYTWKKNYVPWFWVKATQ